MVSFIINGEYLSVEKRSIWIVAQKCDITIRTVYTTEHF